MGDKAVRYSKFDRWPVEDVHRSQINPAEYNPRTIDKYAREKLYGSLKNHGLADKLVWNRRTGNLVGGHQRLSVMDEHEKDLNYVLRCTVVDVDEIQEREMNVALNNEQMTGQYDIEKMNALGEFEGFSFERAGLSGFELESLGISFEAPISDQFKLDKQNEATQEAAADARSLVEDKVQARVDKEKQIEEIKAAKKKYRKEMKEKDSANFNLIIVFDHSWQREQFQEAIEEDPGLTWCDGVKLAAKLDIELKAPEENTEGSEESGEATG